MVLQRTIQERRARVNCESLLAFDGVSQYADAGVNSNVIGAINTGRFTIHYLGVVDAANNNFIFQLTDADTSGQGTVISFNSRRLQIIHGFGGGNRFLGRSVAQLDLPPNRLHLLSLSFDRGVFGIEVNGQNIATTIVESSLSNYDVVTPTARLVLGRRKNYNGSSETYSAISLAHLYVLSGVIGLSARTILPHGGYLSTDALRAACVAHYVADREGLTMWDVVEQYNYAKAGASLPTLSAYHATLQNYTATQVTGSAQEAYRDFYSKETSYKYGTQFFRQAAGNGQPCRAARVVDTPALEPTFGDDLYARTLFSTPNEAFPVDAYGGRQCLMAIANGYTYSGTVTYWSVYLRKEPSNIHFSVYIEYYRKPNTVAPLYRLKTVEQFSYPNELYDIEINCNGLASRFSDCWIKINGQTYDLELIQGDEEHPANTTISGNGLLLGHVYSNAGFSNPNSNNNDSALGNLTFYEAEFHINGAEQVDIRFYGDEASDISANQHSVTVKDFGVTEKPILLEKASLLPPLRNALSFDSASSQYASVSNFNPTKEKGYTILTSFRYKHPTFQNYNPFLLGKRDGNNRFELYGLQNSKTIRLGMRSPVAPIYYTYECTLTDLQMINSLVYTISDSEIIIYLNGRVYQKFANADFFGINEINGDLVIADWVSNYARKWDGEMIQTGIAKGIARPRQSIELCSNGLLANPKTSWKNLDWQLLPDFNRINDDGSGNYSLTDNSPQNHTISLSGFTAANLDPNDPAYSLTEINSLR